MGPVHMLPRQMFLLVPSPSEVPRRNWGRKRGRSSPEQFGNQNNQMTPLLIPRRFLKDIACKRWFLIRFFLEPPCQHNHPSELPRLFSLCNSKNDFFGTIFIFMILHLKIIPWSHHYLLLPENGIIVIVKEYQLQ